MSDNMESLAAIIDQTKSSVPPEVIAALERSFDASSYEKPDVSESFASSVTVKNDRPKNDFDNNTKIELSSKINALIAAINLALANVRAKLANNNSSELAHLETCYTSLSSSAESLLHALQNPESVAHSFPSLCSQLSSLNGNLRACQDYKKKIELQESIDAQNNSLSAELEKAINEHPLIADIDSIIRNLNEIRELNRDLSNDVADIQSGIDNFSKVLKIVNTGNHTTAEAIASEMAEAQYQADLARGLTQEEMVARKEEVQSKIATILERAARIKQAISQNYMLGKEKIIETYNEFVVPSANRFTEKAANYGAKIGECVINHKSTIGNASNYLKQNLSDFFTSINQSVSLDDIIAKTDNNITNIRGIVNSTQETLVFDAEAINMELKAQIEKRNALSDLLSGKSNELKKVAELLEINTGKLLKEVNIFRAENNIELITPTKNYITGIAEDILNVLFKDKNPERQL
ncbi:MAG: hypothetical protein WCJ33_04285 [Pseudomonadota bacterium]